LTRPIVLALLFVSGGTGLVYELVWSKRLANVLGNSGQAHALVLAVFMGGLALGAWIFGGAADRTRRPVALYGALELFVGLYALVFQHVLAAFSSAYLAVAPGVAVAKLTLAALALLPPTIAMGGTVPVLTRFFTRALAAARGELALLYAVNSLGAAAGVLVAGLFLVPAVGLSASERYAAAGNLLLAACAIAMGLKAVPPVVEPEAAPSGSGSARIALACVALTGFTAMLYEITWVRVLAIVIGGTTYAFTLILAAFILGIGLGSFWLARRKSEGDELQLFSRLQVGVVVSICFALPMYGRLPYQFLQLWGSMPRSEATWPRFQLETFFVCCAVVVVPAFFMGASFPAIAKVALRDAARLGRQLGRVYLFNTAGTVAGSLLGGLWLLEAVGLEGNFTVGLSANLLAGALAARTRWLLIAVVSLVAFTAGARGWSTVVESSGRYREWNRTFDSFAQFRSIVRSGSRIVFQGDDVFASVLVGETPRGLRYLRINGKVDASNGDDNDMQVLSAHLGVLLHEGPVKRVLLIGLGTGITAGSLLQYPIERLDVVEISPQVIAAAQLFAQDNHHALDDPRLSMHLDDAKTFLLLQKEPYDLIVSEPSNPWVSGVSGLFSRDFFEIAKQRLAPGGRIVQWIHTYESTRSLVQLVVRTLRGSFEHGTTWLGPKDLVLVGGREVQRFDASAMGAQLERAEVAADLKRVHVTSVAALLSRQVHSDEGQLRFMGEGPVNTDDRNRLEFESPLGYFMGRDVVYDDERSDPARQDALALPQYFAGRTPTPSCAEAQSIHDSLAWAHDDGDPLVIRWAAAERDACIGQPTVGR
jgi:predicted membrane-bound spermidine synthase